jgi:predicted dehydrogenase
MTQTANVKDGASYAPKSISKAVVENGEFCFAVAYMDHGHIFGQTNGLLEAGGTLLAAFEPSEKKRAEFISRYGDIPFVDDFTELLDDPRIHLIASAAIPNRRSDIGLQVMAAGKDYFTDKSPFTSLAQLEAVREACRLSERKYWVYYAERLHNEAAWHAGELINAGAIGQVLHVTNLAPHRLAKESRPEWFFDKQHYGGILTDIGSHQAEQFLAYSGCSDAKVSYARVANLNNPDKPGLEDFGEFNLVADSGAAFYSRVDWFTPEGSPVWGDGRSFIVGTEGSLEVRKYCDAGRSSPASLIVKTDGSSSEIINCTDKVGFPFFGQLILDTLNRTDNAMTQDHILHAAELSLQAQELAEKLANQEYTE